MAKEKNSAAKAVETPVNDNLDTTFENLKKGNLVSQGVNEKALEAIAKSKEEEQIRMAQRAIKEAEYNNLKTVLRLRDQRRRARLRQKRGRDYANRVPRIRGRTHRRDYRQRFRQRH